MRTAKPSSRTPGKFNFFFFFFLSISKEKKDINNRSYRYNRTAQRLNNQNITPVKNKHKKLHPIPYESTKVAKSTKVADTQNHETHK
jgi:hypothetical protein